MENWRLSHDQLQEVEALRRALETSEEEMSASPQYLNDYEPILLQHSLSQLQSDFFHGNPYLDCACLDSRSLSLIEDLIGLEKPAVPSSSLHDQCRNEMMDKEVHAKARRTSINKDIKLKKRIWGVKSIDNQEVFSQIHPQICSEPKKATLSIRDKEHKVDGSYACAMAGDILTDRGTFARPINVSHHTDTSPKNLVSSHDHLNSAGFMEPISMIMSEIEWKKGCQKRTRPWNVMGERLRRKKLNDKLLALRSLVPKISKLDKASIVVDAISYIRELKEQVKKTQEEISHLEATKHNYGFLRPTNKHDVERGHHLKDFKDVIMEMGVDFVEAKTYHLSIHCKKSTDVLVQLARALEDNDFGILRANLTSLNDRILNNFLIEVKEECLTNKEEVHHMIIGVLSQYGLYIKEI